MSHRIKLFGCLVIAVCVSWSVSIADDWRQFRGNGELSVARDAKLPTSWDVKSGENIAWTAELRGRGPSSPIVVNGRVVVTASSGAAQDRLHVLCFDAASGKQLWHRQFWATGRCFTHPQSANAAPTPASDGERIFAFYSSNDLVCLDLDGNLQWYRGLAFDYPKLGNDASMSSSPLVIGDTVMVQVESQGESFAAGLNTATGETRWRIKRQPEGSWSSPVELRGENGKSLVLFQSPKELTAVNPETGEQVWNYATECQGIPSPAVEKGRVYVPAKGITALDASPDSAGAKFLWSANKLGPGAASPVVHEGKLYTINRAPVLACAITETGDIEWQQRLKGAFWATPVIAGEHLYCLNYDGACQVVKLGDDKGKVVSTNEFGETLQASPAVSGNALFVRSDKHLWKISEQ
jgi:outer membrane protein assembly factor BamB